MCGLRENALWEAFSRKARCWRSLPTKRFVGGLFPKNAPKTQCKRRFPRFVVSKSDFGCVFWEGIAFWHGQPGLLFERPCGKCRARWRCVMRSRPAIIGVRLDAAASMASRHRCLRHQKHIFESCFTVFALVTYCFARLCARAQTARPTHTCRRAEM